MGPKKQQHGEFKPKVGVAAIREEGTLQNLAYVIGWIQQALCQMRKGFSKKQERQSLDQEEVLKSLHTKIGHWRWENIFWSNPPES